MPSDTNPTFSLATSTTQTALLPATAQTPSSLGIQFNCTAVDYNLDEAQTCRALSPSIYPDFTGADFTRTMYADVNQWYAGTITETGRLYQIDATRTDQLVTISRIMVESCDAYGHCTVDVIDDTDGDGIPDTLESDGDRDGDGVADMFDYDPSGHFYDITSGRVITGGHIAVSGPGATTIVSDGVAGFYDWSTDGTPGVYVMTVTPPAGYMLSPDCPPQPGPFGPTGDEPIFMGASERAGTGRLADSSCAANPYYLSFAVDQGDPFVFNNNIPLLPDEPTALPTVEEPGLERTVFLPLIGNSGSPEAQTRSTGMAPVHSGEGAVELGADLPHRILLPLVVN